MRIDIKIFEKINPLKFPALMKQTLHILVLLLLFSCNKIGVSETETKAVDKILEFYGGQVNRAIGFKTKNTTKINYFELKVSKSQLLDNDQKDLAGHAGNIAYLFYSNLKDEKSNYQEIKVVIDLQNGESRSYDFPVSDLKDIENLLPFINKTNSFIRKKDYKGFAETFSTQFKADEKDLKNLFDELHSRFGEIKEIQFQGFSFAEDPKVGPYILVKEVLVLDKEAGRMYLNFNRNTKEIVGITFE